jgi:VWFA-related protein
VFVVGFSGSVLLVQDFTADPAKITHAVNELAPSGGTALWDAVTFACQKLTERKEDQAVARILVVITDGEDNSSSATLKQAIQAAERREVVVYAVSSQEPAATTHFDEVGADALKTLSRSTGGALFPNEGRLDHRLAALQQVIRSRYMISYKPAQFQENGSFRSIAITAQKSGHKLRVLARRGYYAGPKSGE